MKIYVTEALRIHGDSFDICVTFDKAEAEAAAEREYDHLTKAERRENEIWIKAFDVQGVAPNLLMRGAKAAYNELLDDDDERIREPVEAERWLPGWEAGDLEDIALTLESEGMTLADREKIDMKRFHVPDKRPMSAEDVEYIFDRLEYHTRD